MRAIVVYLCQSIIALGLLNVWVVRARRETAYRGGAARTILEEFQAYGLPVWSCYFVGGLKISAAVALLAGFVWPFLVAPAAALVAVLMIGAVLMHLKIGDAVKKTAPAFSMLVLCLLLLTLNLT